MSQQNYYFDSTKPHRPFTVNGPSNPGSYPPDNAVRIQPPEKSGYWPCRVENEWQLLPDNRGITIYSTTTGQSVACQEIVIPAGYTTKQPTTPFDKWNGKQWVTDTVAQHQHEIQQAGHQRQSLQHEADTQILRLERIIRRKMATPDEQKRFDAWELYSIELQRL
ncbi:tail fiber assembly protein, partial [Xenorhabdus bovienii]|uniref:tail fiber assembly protein n=1 Tax=Xenorhabdus bovienii TaxID=40576 RepID=UPI0023B255F5